MTARGFCTCKRDHPGNVQCHPAPGAPWHYLCDKPVLPQCAECGVICGHSAFCSQHPEDVSPRIVPTGTGWV